MSTRIRKFFFRKYFFADAKIFASTRSVFESFSAVHTYPIVSGNFLICSSAQFFCRRESWNEHALSFFHFFRAIATARFQQSKLVVYHSKKCLNLLKKSRKSMLIHINGPMMKLNYCWRSRKNTKRSKSPKASTGNLVLTIMARFRHSKILSPFFFDHCAIDKIVPPCACPSWSRPESPSVMVRSFFDFMMPTVHW